MTFDDHSACKKHESEFHSQIVLRLPFSFMAGTSYRHFCRLVHFGSFTWKLLTSPCPLLKTEVSVLRDPNLEFLASEAL